MCALHNMQNKCFMQITSNTSSKINDPLGCLPILQNSTYVIVQVDYNAPNLPFSQEAGVTIFLSNPVQYSYK